MRGQDQIGLEYVFRGPERSRLIGRDSEVVITCFV